MSGLTSPRYALNVSGKIDSLSFPVAAGTKVFQGGVACFDSASPGAVYPASASTTLSPIGLFAATVDNTAGSAAVPVQVQLNREIQLVWLDNDVSPHTVTTSSIGVNEYLADDHTVTTNSSGNSHSGRVWVVRANGQVGVEFPF
jgi:hypothetical protein